MFTCPHSKGLLLSSFNVFHKFGLQGVLAAVNYAYQVPLCQRKLNYSNFQDYRNIQRCQFDSPKNNVNSRESETGLVMEGWLQHYSRRGAEGSLTSQPKLNCLGQAPPEWPPNDLAMSRKHFFTTRGEGNSLSRVPQSCSFFQTGKCLWSHFTKPCNPSCLLTVVLTMTMEKEKVRKQMLCKILNEICSTVSKKTVSWTHFKRLISKNQDSIFKFLDFLRSPCLEAQLYRISIFQVKWIILKN